jgi:NTE family protein
VQVVTTDLESGEPVWWSSGDPVEILMASCCLPGLFPPVRLEGRLHVDGGVVRPVPVDRALELGAENVWVLDVSRGDTPPLPEHPSALDVLLTSFAIARRAGVTRGLANAARDQRVTTITMDGRPRKDLRDFSGTAQLIEEGHAAAVRVLDRQGTPLTVAR